MRDRKRKTRVRSLEQLEVRSLLSAVGLRVAAPNFSELGQPRRFEFPVAEFRSDGATLAEGTLSPRLQLPMLVGRSPRMDQLLSPAKTAGVSGVEANQARRTPLSIPPLLAERRTDSIGAGLRSAATLDRIPPDSTLFVERFTDPTRGDQDVRRQLTSIPPARVASISSVVRNLANEDVEPFSPESSLGAVSLPIGPPVSLAFPAPAPGEIPETEPKISSTVVSPTDASISTSAPSTSPFMFDLYFTAYDNWDSTRPQETEADETDEMRFGGLVPTDRSRPLDRTLPLARETDLPRLSADSDESADEESDVSVLGSITDLLTSADSDVGNQAQDLEQDDDEVVESHVVTPVDLEPPAESPAPDLNGQLAMDDAQFGGTIDIAHHEAVVVLKNNVPFELCEDQEVRLDVLIGRAPLLELDELTDPSTEEEAIASDAIEVDTSRTVAAASFVFPFWLLFARTKPSNGRPRRRDRLTTFSATLLWRLLRLSKHRL